MKSEKTSQRVKENTCKNILQRAHVRNTEKLIQIPIRKKQNHTHTHTTHTKIKIGKRYE